MELINRLRWVLLLNRIPLVQYFLEPKFYHLVSRCTSNHVGDVITLIFGELYRSRSPQKSMMLLNALSLVPVDLIDMNPQVIEFTRMLPGAKVSERLFMCRVVIQRCFRGLSFGPQGENNEVLEEVVAAYEGAEMNMKWVELLLGTAIWQAARKFLDRDPVLAHPDIELVSNVKTKAALGDPDANYMYGLALLYGYGVPPEEKEGLRLLRASADTGNVNAQAVVGYLYYLGYVVGRDEVVGENYLRSAEAKGSPEAARALKYINEKRARAKSGDEGSSQKGAQIGLR